MEILLQGILFPQLYPRHVEDNLKICKERCEKQFFSSDTGTSWHRFMFLCDTWPSWNWPKTLERTFAGINDHYKSHYDSTWILRHILFSAQFCFIIQNLSCMAISRKKSHIAASVKIWWERKNVMTTLLDKTNRGFTVVRKTEENPWNARDSLTPREKLSLYLKNTEKFFHICSFSLDKFIHYMPVDRER